MLLKDFMRREDLTEKDLAEKIGGISEFGVRKLRYRERGPSIRVALRIHEITGGLVGTADLQPLERARKQKASSADQSVAV